MAETPLAESKGPSLLDGLHQGALTLPVVTLLLYLSAIWYLEGFLSPFCMQPHWFSPGVFSLLSFCYRGVLLASVLTAWLAILNFLILRGHPLRWLMAAIWFVMAVWLQVARYHAIDREFAWVVPGMRTTFIMTSVINPLLPIIWVWANRVIRTLAEKRVAAIALLGESSVTDSRARAVAERTVRLFNVVGSVTVPFRSPMGVGLLVLAIWCPMLRDFTRSLGVLDASERLQGIDAMWALKSSEDAIGMDDANRLSPAARQVLFTDGSAVLWSEPVEGLVQYWFRSAAVTKDVPIALLRRFTRGARDKLSQMDADLAELRTGARRAREELDAARQSGPRTTPDDP